MTFYTTDHFLAFKSVSLLASLTGGSSALSPTSHFFSVSFESSSSYANPLHVKGAWGFSVGLSPLSPGALTHSHVLNSIPVELLGLVLSVQ